MDSENKKAFDSEGFVVVRSFLSSSELQELTANLDRYIKNVVPTLPAGDAFFEDSSQPETLKQMHRMGGDPFFREYAKTPQWKSLAEELIGEEANAEHPEWFNKPPNTKHVTPPHQDNYYFCLQPPHVITLWLALDEVDAENGCLRYVAGSHREGFREHRSSNILGFSQGITNYSPNDFKQETAINMKPGDLVAHHGMTIHRADANMSSNRHRRSLAMVFRGVSCQRDGSAFDQYQNSAKEQQSQLMTSNNQ